LFEKKHVVSHILASFKRDLKAAVHNFFGVKNYPKYFFFLATTYPASVKNSLLTSARFKAILSGTNCYVSHTSKKYNLWSADFEQRWRQRGKLCRVLKPLLLATPVDV